MTGILLINGQSDRCWGGNLEPAVLDIGKSLVLVDCKRISETLIFDYELVILDENIEFDLTFVLAYIYSCNPFAPVVVISSALHCKQARETLLAGAVDYVPKIDVRAAILGFLLDYLVIISFI